MPRISVSGRSPHTLSKKKHFMEQRRCPERMEIMNWLCKGSGRRADDMRGQAKGNEDGSATETWRRRRKREAGSSGPPARKTSNSCREDYIRTGGAQEFGESRSRASIVRSYFRINPALAHVEKVNAPTHPTGLKLAQASDVIPWCSCGHDLFIHGEEGRRRGGIPKTSTTPRGTPQMNRCDGCPLEGEVGTTIRFGDRVTVEEIADYLFQDVGFTTAVAPASFANFLADGGGRGFSIPERWSSGTRHCDTRERPTHVAAELQSQAGDETGSARPRLSWAEKKGDWQCVAMQLGSSRNGARWFSGLSSIYELSDLPFTTVISFLAVHYM
ncbi:hypothetical protein K438DRAFT_2047936 [Mycena galopus ATCC 62051]|nr:hypothetical protein K438DRAFT_2047936 [Mycena galopus ATCC 62051]